MSAYKASSAFGKPSPNSRSSSSDAYDDTCPVPVIYPVSDQFYESRPAPCVSMSAAPAAACLSEITDPNLRDLFNAFTRSHNKILESLRDQMEKSCQEIIAYLNHLIYHLLSSTTEVLPTLQVTQDETFEKIDSLDEEIIEEQKSNTILLQSIVKPIDNYGLELA
mmetsp:Transcript_38419/g.46890  ORF Transcript_38419/g.46890 Transcript_38419/m.46890 type:complete len:165 (-) Transcript_38419:132-626(-)|eukprot:CAMPEP_0172506248 /NCGR_PEP_ID=MMETSP1066-20121228/193183_1 /TAXON_ID=671091 /ORGANISM="Coscinodiscus wailesii, Strain CCMP2513" /LENGTH=164 /DNA_ID=CAMNT_0013283187 /DNA_START=167 /DNA_END=661 /DNA_ORIENTATION=-